MRHVLCLFAAGVLFSLSAHPESPADAAAGLATRLLGGRAAEFRFEPLPAEEGKTVFEIEASGGRPVIRGTDGVAMASGLHWYLKRACGAHISWFGSQLNLPSPLPDMAKTRIASPHARRYHFNYCTFSYTMAWWDWERWEREIDWMALNGINMPLAVTGQEAVWQKVLGGLGLTEEEINGFLVGPAYLPFGWMGCMDGWGGPLSRQWIDRHAELGQKILARERALGMTPVLQGFTGHAPAALKRDFPDAALRQTSPWCGFPATHFLDPSDPLFTRIGRAFVEEQTRLFGTDHLYAADTFIEMSPPSSDPEFLAGMARAVLGSMTAADPDAVWVMQGWIFFNNPEFWKPPQSRALLEAVPNDRMILLDLFCDVQPVWTKTEAFYGKPWIWCVVHDFGGNVSLFGNLKGVASGPPAALKDPARGGLCGTGMMMEGVEQNPVFYELMAEMGFRDEAPEVAEWVRDYAARRYGRPDKAAGEAWDILLATVYAQATPSNPVICARPGLNVAAKAPAYPAADLMRAWELLLSCGEQFGGMETYRHDVVTIGRQVLANLSTGHHREMMKAFHLRERERFAAASEKFLGLMDDLDALLATRGEFLLGKWIADARCWGADDAEKRHLEWNARNQITLWGPKDSVLHEYAQKQWAGMVSGFYKPRWEMFLREAADALASGEPLNDEQFQKRMMDWEWDWTHGSEAYADTPTGDPVETTRALFEKHH